MSVPQQRRTAVPKVKWRSVGIAAAIVTGIGLLGLAMVVVPILLLGKDSPDGSGVTVSGAPVLLMVVGALITLVAVIAFIPTVIITATRSRNVKPKPLTAVTPTALSTLPSRTCPLSGEETLEARRERAGQGGNMLGLANRRSQRAGWIILGVVGGGFGILFLTYGLASASPILLFLFPVAFLAVFVVIGWLAIKVLFLNANNDQVTYTAYFRKQSPEIQQWGEAAIEERRWSETTTPLEQLGAEFHRKTAQFLDQFSSLVGGFASRRQPADPWAEAMWRRNGLQLMGREVAMRWAADQVGSNFTPFITPDGATPLPAPTVLIDGGRSAYFYQQRNELVIDDPTYPVRVVDLTMLNKVQKQQKGQPTEYIPQLQTFTYAETWFPADHWVTVYPRTRTSLNRWGGMGKEIDASARQFNRLFDVQTDDVTWARLVLNPAVMKILIDLSPVRFTVDAGRLVIHTHNGWMPVDSISRYAEAVQTIARSARAAETG